LSVNRITYSDRIVDLGRDPSIAIAPGPPSEPDGARVARIREAVSAALEGLTEDEREFIVHFYFQGMSYRQIGEASGRAKHKLWALHERALRRLRQALQGFVRAEFGIEAAEDESCPICASEHREEIDALIAARDRTASWAPVMREINHRFGLRIRAPQRLIGHEKYHRQSGVTTGPDPVRRREGKENQS
jgi:hypothetical protein